MRVLLLMRGSAGCGKSTFIEKHGLKPYTLSTDDIRLLYQSPVMNIYGEKVISGNNEKNVWNTLLNILETRMKNGEFTVIDATNSKTAEMSKYKDLAKKYRYRTYCIDMTDIPIEETKRRNAEREEFKRVPEEVIDKFYSRFKTQQVPSGITALKPEELDKIWYRPMDLSKYDKIHVFGDLHGCYTVLKEYMDSNDGIKEDEFYIFCGDYIDRGIENAETVKYLYEISKLPNIIFLEGNHERWLWMWANNLISPSKQFEFSTKPQLVKAGISQKETRKFYRKLNQCCYFAYHEKTFLVTHGGISNFPDNNLLKIATGQMIKGVGRYADADIVDKAFSENTSHNMYQIHGHRNVIKSPVQTTDRTFNLEGKVEFGGHLRAVQITKDGITPVEIKNTVFEEPMKQTQKTEIANNINIDVYSLVNELRQSKYIFEKQFGRVSSFNFTSQAFKNGIWDDITNKARGLYIDVKDYKIVARAYDKFFNINEKPETKMDMLIHKMQFPVTAYVKENGFLGIVGWNPETEELLITSKSTPTGCFSEYLKQALYRSYGIDTMDKIKKYIKENNVSFVFECCDMENDPHIIEYPESKVVLLDIVKNQMKFEKMSYEELMQLANELGIKVKEKAFVIKSWEDFYAWYNEVTSEGYKYKGNNIEGFVIEDSVGYMTKLKLFYYKYWKRLRGVAQSVLKYGDYKYTDSLLTREENEFLEWCKSTFLNMTPEEKESAKSYTSICDLRKEFYDWKTKPVNIDESLE